MVKSRKFIYLFSIIIVLAISVGYAALGSKMSLSNLVAEVRIKEDIRITDVSVYSTEGSPNYNYVKYDKDSIISYFNMNAGDSITFKVEITNIENAEMGILNLSGLPDGVSYSFGDSYTEKEKLCNDAGLCNLGMVKEIYLTITSDSTSISGDEYNIDFNFQPFYTVSYDSSITNNGYPTEIISGGDLVIAFTDPVPDSVKVYSDGLEVDSSLYTYVNGILTYNNISGNIVLKSNKTLYKIMQMATNGPDTNIDFGVASSSTNGDGVNTVSGTESDEYPIYYYRGAVENNNVLFAGFCWKMVRTTELGGVKLIYSGIPTSDNYCNGDGSSIGTSAFNNNTRLSYGKIDDLRYIRTDGTDSVIKTFIDDWYSNNILAYTDFLEDEKWCNDVKFSDSSGHSDAYNRLSTSPYQPTLECLDDYQYYISSTLTSNKLKYPIALLTADELTYAGNGTKGYSSTAYLSVDYNWWTMTAAVGSDSGPTSAKIFYSTATGILYTGVGIIITNSYNVRPSIVLKNGIEVENGDGVATNPYTLDVPQMISFKIDDSIYYAEDGMTWKKWVESEYNNGTVWLDNEMSTSESVCHDLAVVYYNDTAVGRNNSIISGGLYHTNNACAPV